MHAYATGPDLNRLIARARGDPARLDHDDGYSCLLTNCWLPVRRAKSTNYADRRGFAQLRSRGGRNAPCPTPPPRASRHFEAPTEGTRRNSWACGFIAPSPPRGGLGGWDTGPPP